MAIKKSDLYSSIWASCDELRGGMDASQYKDYDGFEPPLVIPPGASFRDMVALEGKDDIGDRINTQVIQPPIDANTRLARSDFPDFNDPNKLGDGAARVERLGNLIAIVENPALDFSQNRAEHDDILGDAYDPTCGSGSLLLKVAAEAGKHITLEGQEKDSTTAGFARMNMILHDFPTATVASGGEGTLVKPRFLDGEQLRTYDYVVANPPFSDKTWSTGLALGESGEGDRHKRFSWGVPPKKQGDYAAPARRPASWCTACCSAATPRPRSAAISSAPAQLVSRQRPAFQRHRRGFQPQGETDHQKSVRLSDVSRDRNRLVSCTWRSTRAGIDPQILLRRHFSVHPPSGRVTLVAPTGTRLEVARAYAITKRCWIRAQQSRLRGQAREAPRRFVERETRYLWGRRYLLSIRHQDAKPHVALDHRRITLTVRPGTGPERRTEIVHEWHKSLLHAAVAPLIRKWEPELSVTVSGYFLQRMKTKWGSCNHRSGHIRLNTELVKKPKDLLEYVIVHEMTHLLEPTHSERFLALLDRHYRSWREARAELNELSLSAEKWNE